MNKHQDSIQHTVDEVRLHISPREPGPYTGYLTKSHLGNADIKQTHASEIHIMQAFVCLLPNQVKVARHNQYMGHRSTLAFSSVRNTKDRP